MCEVIRCVGEDSETKSNVWWKEVKYGLRLPKIFLSFSRIYLRNQHRFRFTVNVTRRHKILIDASLARDRRNVESYFRFPWYLSRSWYVINREYKPIGRQKMRACREWNPRKSCDIKGSISNRIPVHHVFNLYFLKDGRRHKTENTPFKDTRCRKL